MALCAGVHKLSKQQLEKIQKGINALAEELVAIKIKKLRISKRQVKMSKTGQNILFTLILSFSSDFAIFMLKFIIPHVFTLIRFYVDP